MVPRTVKTTDAPLMSRPVTVRSTGADLPLTVRVPDTTQPSPRRWTLPVRRAIKNSGDLTWPSLTKFRVEKLVGLRCGRFDDDDGASDHSESAVDLAQAKHVPGDEGDC